MTDMTVTVVHRRVYAFETKKHPLKSFSEERDENWISQVCVYTGEKVGAV